MLELKRTLHISRFFKLSAKNSIYFFSVLFFCTNFDTGVYYFLFGIVLLIFLLSFVRKPVISINDIEDKIALSFILVWMYGFVVGVFRGTPLQYVFANFAGMSCYILYFYYSYFKCSIQKLTKIILIGGYVLSIYALLRMIFFIFGMPIPFFDMEVGISSTGQLRVYFTSLCVAYGLLGISFAKFIVKGIDVPNGLHIMNNGFIVILGLIVSTVSILFVASSKGFMLGGFFILTILPFLLYARPFIHGCINLRLLGVIFVFILIFLSLIYFDYFSILEMMFDESDSSNVQRYDQLSYMLNDCSVFGKGLGASVPGSIRSEEKPYGFELTYINLVHKFGVFSVFIFGGYLYMFLGLFKQIWKRNQLFYAVMALSCLGYLFPSIGNPLLYHPCMSFLNCYTLYALKLIRKNEKNISLHGYL